MPPYYYPYLDNKALEGFLKPFFDDHEFCTGDCDACGHCAFFAAASMGTNADRELFLAAKESFNKEEEPFAAYRRQHAAKRLFLRVARRGYSVARSMRYRLLGIDTDKG